VPFFVRPAYAPLHNFSAMRKMPLTLAASRQLKAESLKLKEKKGEGCFPKQPKSTPQAHLPTKGLPCNIPSAQQEPIKPCVSSLINATQKHLVPSAPYPSDPTQFFGNEENIPHPKALPDHKDLSRRSR
jgi:hypothetical protein